MAISVKNWRVEQKNHSFLVNWPDGALCYQHLFRLNAVLSGHPRISVSLPRLLIFLGSTEPFGQPSASLDFLHSVTPPHFVCGIYVYLSVQDMTQQKAFSPYAGALSLWHSPPQWGYRMVRVPRNLDSSFFLCPVFDSFLSFSVNCLFILSRPLCRKLRNASRKWWSLLQIEVNHPSFNNFAVSSQHLIRLFAVLSIHLFISVSGFHSFTMHAVSLSVCPSQTQIQKAFSLHVDALSLCDTHYLNTDMVGCGCHEILIQRCITVLLLSNYSLYSIQISFRWLSYSKHSFQLISIQHSVHHSDLARNHQSCNQKPFISTSNWRQVIFRHIFCWHSNKACEFAASTMKKIH